MSLAKRPWAGSACQGGMRRVLTTSPIIGDQPRTIRKSVIAQGATFMSDAADRLDQTVEAAAIAPGAFMAVGRE